MKNMYDGYIFGRQEIYNPWSILNYANRKEIQPYWINTSSDELLKDLFNKTKEKTSQMVEKLIIGEEVQIEYNDKITFLDLNAVQTDDAVTVIGNFLLFAGYLTKADKVPMGLDRYIKVKIPNKEVNLVYTDIISEWTAKSAKFAQYKLYELKQKMLENDVTKIEEILNEALQSMSFMDEHENFYHGYMLGLFVSFMMDEYIVKFNREAGKGRFDIMIESLDRSVGIVVEFKVVQENENLTKKAEEGKQQIVEKEYFKELELDGVKKILTYAVAFKGKECKVG